MSYAILIYDGVEPIDIGATFGVLSMASRKIPELEFFGVACAIGPVHCAGGLTVQADHDFQSCPPVKNVIVTGGPGWSDAANDRPTIDFLQARAQTAGTRISAICTGAMILAAAGLLDGKAATTKVEVFDGEMAPADILAERTNTRVRAGVVVDAGGILTSGGVTLGIDAVFHLLARDYGNELSDDVARVMEYARALNANREALGYVVE
ncbi:MAG: DJ-1/PfpI family protein [Hyphomicrobiaceae bacterium]